MLEIIKFSGVALGSAILVGGFLSVVVDSVIKSSQNTRTSGGERASAAAPRAHAKAGYSQQEENERQGRVAFSSVRL